MIRVYKNRRAEQFYYDWVDIARKAEAIPHSLLNDFINYFNNKCVFCESSVEEDELFIDYYRPVKGVRNTVSGEFFPNHYDWLKYDWENLIIICRECNRAKSNRFPLRGNICEHEANENELLKEKRLLLNPFRDYPEKHFLYDEAGLIIPKTPKGQASIEVLGLNRTSLVERRRYEYDQFKNLCGDYVLDQPNNDLVHHIIEQIKPYSPMAGIKRHLLINLIIKNQLPALEEFRSYLSHRFDGYGQIYRWGREERKALEEVEKKTYLERERRNVNYDIMNNLKDYYGKQRYIESVEIQNFRALKNFKLDLRASKSKTAPWHMLLGENGIGKSSVLQAITLALMGQDERQALGIKPAQFLNKQSSEGSVSIRLTGVNDPIRIFLEKDARTFKGVNHHDPKVLILSYGSTRLLPRQGVPGQSIDTTIRVENLFNPFKPLVDVESYLESLDLNSFQVVKQALESLFTEDIEIEKNHRLNKIFFTFPNKGSVQLQDLSDGFQTIIALATDIMMVMKTKWRSDDAEGVVLIDELDAHLHPRWNIEIVSRLRKAFPMVQFISTTHNPLTLRGLNEGEVSVMKENENRETIVLQNLPPQMDIGIEEMLTSKFFGLSDTAPETNVVLDEYYTLLANPEPDEEQKSKIEDLRSKLTRLNKVGLTTRDQKFYEAVDIFLARQRNISEVSDSINFEHKINELIDSLERKFLK